MKLIETLIETCRVAAGKRAAAEIDDIDELLDALGGPSKVRKFVCARAKFQYKISMSSIFNEALQFSRERNGRERPTVWTMTTDFP